MRAYKNIPDNTFKMSILFDDVQMPSDILGPGRASLSCIHWLTVLSLAEKKECRILDPSDLDYPR